ncbi:MAG: peroxidase family protein [Verrucomicrobia bacterium]|nr:peroxidase family protein [Verrucomicrobiota bacterium]
MRKKMHILQCTQKLGSPPPAFPARRRNVRTLDRKLIPAIVASVSFFAASWLTADDLPHRWNFEIRLLREFRPIGGSGNNLQNPDLNVAPGAPELALAPLNFAPGTNDGLANGPNARTISNLIAGGTGANGQNGQTTDPVASAWLYVFGQFVDHDLDLEETLPTSAPIDIAVPSGDPVFTPGRVIAMTRDTRSPITNTIINTVAGYLDLSQLYGSTTAVAASLRNPDGTLITSDNGQALPVVNDAFVAGDPRVMENPELTAVTTLFMREHNFWVGTLKRQHPNWTGDQLYDMAKAITTAEYQNIIYNEYLPLLIGPVLGSYRGYDPTVNAQVTQEFSTAAFRMGHSEVSDTQEGLDANGNVVFTEPLAQAFFNTPEIDEANGIDPLLRSLGVDFSQATDVYVVSALRNLLFADLVGGDVDEIDLIAIDVQRERDVGLATLNLTRQALGLKRYDSFAELTSDRVLQKNLQSVYGSVDNVDLFIGGLAEKHAAGALVGPTFQAIIADQFHALRAGDRFFWQNQGFDERTASMISNTTLTDLMKRNTATPNLQENLFIESALPTHVQPHATTPVVIDTHGRKRFPFTDHGM